MKEQQEDLGDRKIANNKNSKKNLSTERMGKEF